MCPIQDNARPNTGSNSTSKNGDAEDPAQKFAYVKIANKKVSLLDILRHYGLKIEMNPQRPNWSNNITCPLPGHKGARERSASFGYCFKTGHFTCLGCRASGQAVEFISAMEGLPRHVVAEQIISKYGGSDEIEDYRECQDDISPILIDCAAFLRKTIQENKTNKKLLQKVDKLIWWIDFYLASKAPNSKITAEDLLYRVEKVKGLL